MYTTENVICFAAVAWTIVGGIVVFLFATSPVPRFATKTWASDWLFN